jgi:sulfite exporter TauE/SafE
MNIDSILYLLVGCLALGMLHGVLPDEHTWPITFAYSVGTTTGKGGMKSGAFFAAAFTVQRAIMSQIVYFVVGFFLVSSDMLNGPVYAAVGVAMAIAGYLILSNRFRRFHPFLKFSKKDLSKHKKENKKLPESERLNVPVHWCIIHGFISGFGVDTGILSTFIYLTTLPALSAAGLWQIGWLPGALFGLGTFAVLMFIGFFFGKTLDIAKRFGAKRISEFGRLVGARILLFGGIIFMMFGPLYYFGIAQQIPLDTGTLIVMLIMVGVAVPTMVYTWKEVKRMAI